MSWSDPSTYIFLFEDGTEISCNGLIGIFTSNRGLDAVYKELGLKSFESYTSETREEYLKYLDIWKDELPEKMKTEECINTFPVQRKYFDSGEGMEMIKKLRCFFENILKEMERDFNFIQQLISGNSEIILNSEMDWDIEEMREPEHWWHTHQYSIETNNSGVSWFYSGDDDDVAYSAKEIQHVRLLVEFFDKLEKEFQKQTEKKSGWYVRIFTPY